MRTGFRSMRQMVRRVLDIFGFKDNSNNYISMETKHKELYEHPSTDVVEVHAEGVVCQSVKTTYNPMNPEEEWTF